jgi:hypothetical protein
MRCPPSLNLSSLRLEPRPAILDKTVRFTWTDRIESLPTGQCARIYELTSL